MTEEASEPARTSTLPAISVDRVLQIGCLAVLVYWSLLLVQPFLTIIIWSIILAVVLYPGFNWMVSSLRLPRWLAALLITIASFAVVLGPASWLALSLIASVRFIFEGLSSGAISIPPPSESIKHWPLVGESVYEMWYLAATNLKAAFAQLIPQLKPLGSSLLGVAGNAGLVTLQFMAAVALSGFLFLPGPSLVDTFKSISERIAAKRGEEFVDLAGMTIRNLARGVIGISMLQALLAGIGLIIAGVSAAGLFSFLILFLGIIQVGGSIVLIPLIIWSWLAMDASSALIFSAYMLPVGFVDNLLRPIVLAHGLKTPMPVIFIGVIGGILVHGVIGLFVGPIVLAIAWELLMAWIRGEVKDLPVVSAQGAEDE